MARLTRHELKKDEFHTRLTKAGEFLRQHRKHLALGGAAGLLAAAIVFGFFYYIRSQQAKAAEAFGDALETYYGTVTASPPPNSRYVFKTADEKYAESQKRFAEVSKNYSRYSAGRMARYYAAISLRELGKLPEAEKELQAVASAKDKNLAALAQMALANVYERAGRTAEAEKLYREIESHPTVTVPKATAQMARAKLYEATQPAQAVEIYKQMQQEHSGTTVGEMASKKLEDLSHAAARP